MLNSQLLRLEIDILAVQVVIMSCKIIIEPY